MEASTEAGFVILRGQLLEDDGTLCPLLLSLHMHQAKEWAQFIDLAKGSAWYAFLSPGTAAVVCEAAF
jgi:hypothetical protein